MAKFFNHFKVFLIIALAAIIVLVIYHAGTSVEFTPTERDNDTWTSTQRVFDYADKLTDEDEAELTNKIYELEQTYCVDMAVLILDENLTSYVDERRDLLDYDVDTAHQVMVYADDFSYENGLGWNGFNGDAIVLCDNWNREADGSIHTWVSTAGRCIDQPSSYECTEIIDDAMEYIEDDSSSSDIEAAYEKLMTNLAMASVGQAAAPFGAWVPVVVGLIVAIIYIAINMKGKVGKVTTTDKTYVKEGSANVDVRLDTFSHKTVSKSPRPKDTGSDGGSHSSSGGGSFGGGGSSR